MNDGWSVSYIDSQQMNGDKLASIIADIPQNNPKLDGIVLIKNGKLIVDQYYNGYHADSLHKIWSITKLVSGTCIGIASDNNLLSIDDSIINYLEEFAPDNPSELSNITIKHLLTMTSGLDWVELGGPGSIGYQLPYSDNWVSFVLKQSKKHPAGELYNYSTGNSILLAPILKKSTGTTTEKFAQKHLFGPLEIRNFQWDTQNEFWTKTQSGELPGSVIPKSLNDKISALDFANTGSGLHMRLRDIAKIGQLYLNDGKWNDEQILSKRWIEESIHPQSNNNQYGYHWRLTTFNGEECYYTTGFGLQRLYVFPRLDMVLALSQQHYQTMAEGDLTTQILIKELITTVFK